MRRAGTLAAAVAAALALAGCDAAEPGIAAWRDGRPRDALAEFTDAAAAQGAGASPELLYDRALAALATGDLAVAEASADAAALRGGPEFVPLRDFVRGNAAFARSESAAAEAPRPGAAAPVDRAISHAETALRAWRSAAASRDDWPEARRNAERALLHIERLRARRGRPLPGIERASLVRPRPLVRPDPQAPARDPSQKGEGADAQAVVQRGELSAEEVRRLAGVLARKEEEKLALRRAERERRQTGVERDW